MLHHPSVTGEDFPSRTRDVILRATELMFACCWCSRGQTQRTDSGSLWWTHSLSIVAGSGAGLGELLLWF